MGSKLTQPATAGTKMTLTPVMTLDGHNYYGWTSSMAYSPDGKRIIGVFENETIRQWDLQAGKEVEVRGICERRLYLAEVSRDGRWVITSGRDEEDNELKVYEVETGIVKTFQDSRMVCCIDISADGKLLASGSIFEGTALIWGMDTGKLVAGPFKSDDGVDAIQFSPDSKKLAVESRAKKCLEVWDVQTQKLDARVGKHDGGDFRGGPMFWTKKGTILAMFNFDFDDHHSNIPPDILASIRLAPDPQAIAPNNSTLNDLLNSDATRRRNTARLPMISLPPRPLQPMHTRGIHQPVFLRHLRNILSFSSHLDAVPAVQSSQPRDPLDTPATSSRIQGHTPVAHTTQGYSHSDPHEHSRNTTTLKSANAPATLATRIQYLSRWWPVHTSHQASPIVDVPLAQGRLRNAAAGAPKNDEDLIPDEYFDTSSQNPDSQQPSAAARIDTGEHGHGGLCFCF